MATVKYTYLITDFLNDAVYAGKLGEEIEASSITTALSYINTFTDVCDIYFDSALTAPEVTTLDGLVAAHDGEEPIVDAGLVLSPDGVGSFDWGNIAVISGAVTNLDLENVYEIVATVSGAAEAANAGITTLSGVVQNFIDNLYETITVTSGSLQSQIDDKPDTFLDLEDTPTTYSGLAGKVPIINVTEDGLDFITASGVDVRVFSFALRESSKDYFEVSSTTWVVAATFPFPGTDSVVPSKFSIVGSRDGTTDLSECRLYDTTNTTEILYMSWSSEAKTIYSSTDLSNLSPNEAMLEVQIKKTSNPASKTRIHSAVLR